MTRALGKTQKIILDRLSKDDFHNGCGWIWKNYHETTKILKSLIKRNLVTVELKAGLVIYKTIRK
jgi:hypothetical protein